MEIARILYATDGSPHARKALDWVVDIAKRRQAQVIIVTAYEPIPRELGTPHLEELMARRPAEAQEIADQAAEALERDGVPHEVDVLEGPPAEAILTVARTRRCDLIVMGSRGRRLLEAMLLGSVSQRVVQEAPCPVLIVR